MSELKHVEEWFSKRRMGLFLHFGLYSIEAWHEQDQMRRRIPRDEYGKLIHRFNPTRFDADAILDLAESVGMEYVCLTTKHHDGFCLWDTQETAFNVMNSPYGRDLVRQMADACHRRHFPLGLYYSVVDWHHPNYPNQGKSHELPGPLPGDQPDLKKYIDFLVRQVRELCTRYGELRMFWWDMNLTGYMDPSINAMIRELQPKIAINPRGFDKGDFGTPEREFDKPNTDRLVRFERFTEACNAVGTQSWGYRHDEDYYSTAFLMQSIASAMAKGGHYLLNVGPDGSGRITGESVRILQEIGAWYRKTRQAYSDTVPASELTNNRDVLLTRRGNTFYVHLVGLPVPSDAVVLSPISDLPARAVLLNTGEELRCTNEMLPRYWRGWGGTKHALRVKGLPRHVLAGQEIPVIQLDFDHSLTGGGATVAEFKG